MTRDRDRDRRDDRRDRERRDRRDDKRDDRRDDRDRIDERDSRDKRDRRDDRERDRREDRREGDRREDRRDEREREDHRARFYYDDGVGEYLMDLDEYSSNRNRNRTYTDNNNNRTKNKYYQNSKFEKREGRQRGKERDTKWGVGGSRYPYSYTPAFTSSSLSRPEDRQEREERRKRERKERIEGEQRTKDFGRNLQQLVEHRTGRRGEVKKAEKREEGDKQAKQIVEVLEELNSIEEKALYIATMLGYVAKKAEKVEPKKEREKKEVKKVHYSNSTEDAKKGNRSKKQKSEDKNNNNNNNNDSEMEEVVEEEMDEEVEKKNEERDEEGKREEEKSRKGEGEKEKGEERERKGGKEEIELVRKILGYFHTGQLDLLIESLSKYIDVKPLLTEEVLVTSMTRTMNHARKKLLSGTNQTKLEHSFAIRAFDAKGYAQPFLSVQKLDETEKSHPFVSFESNWATDDLKYGMRSIVPSRELFAHAWHTFTHGFFENVDLAGGIITGGAVSACLQPIHPHYLKRFGKFRELRRIVRKIALPPHIVDRIIFYSDLERELTDFKRGLNKNFGIDERGYPVTSPHHNSDVDIFITAKSLEEGERKLKTVFKNIKKRFKQLDQDFIITRTNNAITFCCEMPYRHIQIIVSTLRSLDDFLLFCDLDCTSVAYDGREVYMSPRSVRAFNKRYNIIAPDALNNPTRRCRIMKYAARGFSTMIFELCKHVPRCDVALTEPVYTQFMNMTCAEKYEKDRMVRMGDYPDERPFSAALSLSEIQRYCYGHNLPFGKKFKEIWTKRVKSIEEIKRERERDRKRDEERAKKRQREEERERERWYEIGMTDKVARRFEEQMDRDAEREEERDIERYMKLEDKQIEEPGMRWKWEDMLTMGEVDNLLPRCYMCHKRSIPSFSDEKIGLTLCNDCIKKNETMMNQWDSVKDIEECVALVTGARIKIGYYIALRLLRSGATVIGVTRFPHDAALRYSQEPDFDKWKDKLHIYGVDLRHLPSVNEFIAHVLAHYKRIDMLINNAAQTKRRPRAYYHSVVERERKLMGGELKDKFMVKDVSKDPFMLTYDISPEKIEGVKREKEKEIVPIMAVGNVSIDNSLPKSAALTQVQLHPMDIAERDDSLFPPGMVDEHNEPLDIRPSTSWNQMIDEISTVELVEVQIVNSTVPFMFISSFTPLLKRAAEISHHKRAFVVNVTAVEGMFSYNKKSGGHPHTNMAKAALNMMTKSIGDTFAQSRIYSTAVDTGWCTEMRYVPMDKRDEKGVPLNPVPLTDKDGAARVLYPIFLGLTNPAPPPHGVLYHDYEVVPWN